MIFILETQMISHGGAVPGFSAQVSFLPTDGVGLVALANGDGKHQALLDIQTRVYREFLGLQEDVDKTKYAYLSNVRGDT
jgi:hypothetical protein